MHVTELVIAEFNATVGVPVLPGGVTHHRPEVVHLHSDHEGGYESHAFEGFRAEEGIHHTMSPPHDHNLNPIAERTIGVISDLCKATKLSSGTPVTFWPYLVCNAVDWHNSVPGSTGSSSASEALSPYQRFTKKLPRVMDLLSFGCHTVALSPNAHLGKPVG